MITEPVPLGEHVPTADQRIVLHRVSWAHYEAQLAMRGDAPVPRITYLDGVMELMSPSKVHERIISNIGRLVEAYAASRGIELGAYRSWTLTHPTDAGAEPDECYIFGSEQDGERPDLVIEVIWTSGGINKLEVYRRLGVREVWFWRAGKIEIHSLEAGTYVRRDASRFLPELDVKILASCLDRPTLTQALRAFRAALDGER
jgi:Uma2 family endonuclease